MEIMHWPELANLSYVAYTCMPINQINLDTDGPVWVLVTIVVS